MRRLASPWELVLAEVQRALLQDPIAILLTEPGYLGTISDLRPLIEAAHAQSVPVIIDAAWGGHFGFAPGTPQHCLQLGADALITSIHKALPGYSASALLLAQGKYLNLARVEQSFETTHTTSHLQVHRWHPSMQHVHCSRNVARSY